MGREHETASAKMHEQHQQMAKERAAVVERHIHWGAGQQTNVPGIARAETRAMGGAGHVEHVPIAQLHRSQETISTSRYEKLKSGNVPAEKLASHPVRVARSREGKLHVIDGHTRITLAHDRGETSVDAQVVDLEE